MKQLLIKSYIFFLIPLLFTWSSTLTAQDKNIEEPISVEVDGGTIEGTLLIPQMDKKMPVVLLIAGSGPTDRDGNNPQMKNNSLKMMAEELAIRGVATLRFDKRGIAASANIPTPEKDLRFDHYIDDARLLIDLLRGDKRFSEVVVAGHSEGSLIGMAASEKADKYISLAGAGEPIDIVLRRQLSAQPAQIQEMTDPIIDSLKKGVMVYNVSPFLASLFRESVQPYLISWFKYDPAQIISTVTIPVLIIQGDKDIQVTVQDAEKLAAANKSATKVIIKDMNHVFKIIEGGQQENVASYTDPTMPISSTLIDEMTKFIKKD